MEKLISKKEQAEEKNKPISPTFNSPNSPLPRPPTEIKYNLEAEIKQLQSQIKDLENNINSALSTQKETYQKMLASSKKDLEDRQKEKDKIGKSENNPTSPNKNNNKLN